MLIAAFFFFLRLLRLNRTAAHVLCIAALWAYLPFVGMIPSLFRAVIMATAVIAALLFEKKNYGMQRLGLAGTVWLALSPEDLFGAGYQLSFAATAGILLLFPVMQRCFPKPKAALLKKPAAYLFASLALSGITFLASAPVQLYHFGTVSWFGLLANLVAVAAMTLAMWAFLAGLLFQMIVPFAAAIPLWVAERFMDIVTWTAGLARHVPLSNNVYPAPPAECIVLFALLLFGAAAIRADRLRRYLAVAAIIGLTIVPADMFVRHSLQRIEAVRFALPRTDLLGVRWPNGRVWLITPKAGRSLPQLVNSHVTPWLRHSCGNRIDALVLPESDACRLDSAAATLPITATATITAIQDSSFDDPPCRFFSPCDGCSCTIAPVTIGRGKEALRVSLTAPGFDTALILATPPRSRGNAAQAAVVMRPDANGIDASPVLPPDHPVR